MTELDLKPPPDFDLFYSTYPRKVGKKCARKAWKSAIKEVTPRELQDAVEAFAAITQEQTRYQGKRGNDKTDALKYTVHPATWLNQGRWDDEAITEYLSKPKETGTILKEGEPGFTEWRDHLIAEKPSHKALYERFKVFVVPAKTPKDNKEQDSDTD